jgi:putative Holliday junction resolvase
MKYIGVDYGTKRVGLAISDDEGRIAFAHEIVPTGLFLDVLKQTVGSGDYAGVVLGRSDSGSGRENDVAKEIERAHQNIKKHTNLPVHLENEYGTSAFARSIGRFFEGKPRNQARKTKQSQERVDAHAAALILQRFLDRMNSTNS